MVGSVLTSSLIEDGERLLRQLEADGYHIATALWVFQPERENWRLKFEIVEYDSVELLDLYGAVIEALRKIEVAELRPDMVSILDPGSEFVSTLRTVLNTGPGIHGVRFTESVVNGKLLDDAYVYRLT